MRCLCMFQYIIELLLDHPENIQFEFIIQLLLQQDIHFAIYFDRIRFHRVLADLGDRLMKPKISDDIGCPGFFVDFLISSMAASVYSEERFK